jgi:hypothetical protein
MAEKTKHRAAAAAGADPDGEAWTLEAGKRWTHAVAESERLAAAQAGEPGSAKERKAAARGRKTALELYDAPPLPDFRAAAAKELELGKDDEILGRFVFQPGAKLVHDVSKAGPACRIQETPRLFVHFASELETAVPEDAEPHSCMTA